MKTWTSVTAEELIVKRSGSIDPKKFPDEVFELFSIPAFDCNEPEILTGQQIGSSKICIEPGDVLLSRIVPHIRRCWIVPTKSSYRQMGSGEWIIFRDHRFHPNFLKHFLTSDYFHNQFMNTVAGVGGSLLRARPAQVAQIKIPLPPLEEQKRIAAILDKADAIRRKRQQAIQLADDFLRSVFLDMFGDPMTNLKGWEKKPLKKLGKAITGSTPPSSLDDMWGDEIFFVTPSDLTGFISNTQRKVTVAGANQSRECRAGSLLVCCIGTIGKVGISDKKVTFNQQINAQEWNENINDFFGYTMFNLFPNLVVKNAIQTTLPILKKSLFEEIEIPVPPIALQEKFADIFKKTKQLKDKNEKTLKKELLAPISQKAFRGEL